MIILIIVVTTALMVNANAAIDTSRMHMLTTEEKEIIVQTHNDIRRELTKQGNVVPDLTWDEDLAKFAFHYIQNSIKQYSKCPQKHNPNLCWYHGSTVDTLGENVAHNSQPLINESIWLWINERKDYTYSRIPQHSDKNAPVTGHYTQLVWGRTQKVGCAIGINCLGFNGRPFKFMLLCNYWPSGNVGNQFPYYKTPYPDDWKVFEYQLSDTCRYQEDKKGNWDNRKKLLKNPVSQAYHKLELYPGKKSVYDELVGNDLNELICNVVKKQSTNESGIDKLKSNCKKFGHKPITKQLSVEEIFKRICKHTYRLAKKQPNAYHKGMADYCDYYIRKLKLSLNNAI